MKQPIVLLLSMMLCYCGLHAQTNLLSPSAEGGFEHSTNTFAANGWTVVNDAYNNFYIGTAPVPSAGSFCAFSGSNASTWTGSPNVSVSHFYRDITFGSEGALFISFRFKITDSDPLVTDYLTFSLVSTSTVPVAGTELVEGQLTKDNDSPGWYTYTLPVDASGFGTSVRLVFSWVTDNVAPNAAVAIDEVSLSTYSELSGTKTIPDDYATIKAAVEDLNFRGVGSGGITFNIAAGHTETIDSPIILEASGTSSNPIVFQKSGVGDNPMITAYAGTRGGDDSEYDGIWMLAGADYVLIDGINLFDPNLTSPEMMEYGFAMLKRYDDLSGYSDGCQYNTIQNCVISLSKDNNEDGIGAVGIYIADAYSYAAGNINSETLTAEDQTNSFNKIYTNTIQNCNHGIYMYGPTNYGGDGAKAGPKGTLNDHFNDIGGASEATGNTILNFGGAAVTARAASGITFYNQDNINVSYNTINNNNGSGVNHTHINRGIYAGNTDASNDTYNTTISYNAITLHGGATTRELEGVYNNIMGNTSTINILHNSISGDYTTATSGYFYGILSNSDGATINISNNTVSDFSFGSADVNVTGGLYGIGVSATVCNTLVLSNNHIHNLSRTGLSEGSAFGIYNSVGTNRTISGNIVSNLSSNQKGNIYGVFSSGGGTLEMNANEVYNLASNNVTNSRTIYGIKANCTNTNFTNNSIHDITHNGTGEVRGFDENGSNSGTHVLSGNQIYNLTGNSTIFGIWMNDQNVTVSHNKLFNLQSNMTSQTYTVYGIYLFNCYITASVINNFVGALKAPTAISFNTGQSPTLRGIQLNASNPNTTVFLDYNTIYLDANSTGADFGTTALYIVPNATSTTANLTMRNNIIINKSTAAGSGKTVALMKSSEEHSNYNILSDNNLFYAGTPGPSNLIYFSPSVANESLDQFKALVAPREAHSISGDLVFLSTTGTSDEFLHLDPQILSIVSNAGTPIAAITTDFDGDNRHATTPDIGADEFELTLVWTGATSQDWGTAANWQQGIVPSAENHVIISNVTNDPVVNESISNPAVCNNLTINSNAQLTINAGKALSVNGTLTNSAGTGGLIIKSDATGTGSLIHNTANVAATVERYITGNSNLTAFDYHLVSVPLDAAVTNAQFMGSYLYHFDAATQQWVSNGTSTSTAVPVDAGYMIYYPNASTTYNFTGELNNGSFTAATGLDAADEFALVPNPYPSAIDWDAASGWTKTNLRNAIYVWDPVGNQYAAYGAEAGINGGTRYIPAGQAFFVKSSAASTVLAMNNSVRVHNTQAFWKDGEVTKDLLRVKALGNGLGDEIVLRFRQGTEAGLDLMDVDKLFGSDEAPQLFTLTADERQLSVNTQPYSQQTVVVPMGFELKKDVEVSLNFSGIEAFEPTVNIFLEDSFTGQMINLRENPVYTFSHTQGNEPQRFKLHLMGVTAVGETPSAPAGQIWSDGNTLYLSFPELQGQKVLYELFDLNGRLLESRELSPKTIQRLRPQASGIVIARLSLADQVYVNKLFIR